MIILLTLYLLTLLILTETHEQTDRFYEVGLSSRLGSAASREPGFNPRSLAPESILLTHKKQHFAPHCLVHYSCALQGLLLSYWFLPLWDLSYN